MKESSASNRLKTLSRELGGKRLPRVWGRRSFWQVRLRWWVPPLILVAASGARAIGYDFPLIPVFAIALSILAYNFLLARGLARAGVDLEREPKRDRRMAMIEVTLDYAAMFLLIFFTGGLGSPLIFFFLFHVIFAAIQFKARLVYLFAGSATLGMWLLYLLQTLDWLPCRELLFRGQGFCYLDHPGHAIAKLLFFSATLLTTAMVTTRIMSRLRSRVRDLTKATQEVSALNYRLESLYAMLHAVGTTNQLQPILDIVVEELADAMVVKVAAVKLLDPDGKTLRFVAAHGLSQEFLEKKVVQLAESPLNRRVIDGETVVHGDIDVDSRFQLREELEEMGIKSVAFAPLLLEGRVIGILGIYCVIPHRFDSEDSSFLRMAAELVAVAVENARSFEAVETLMKERSSFMLRVAHNMRAPLGASLSLMEVIRDGTMGDLNERQAEYLGRVDLRLRTLNDTIGDLLTLSRSKDLVRDLPPVDVIPAELAELTEQTFSERAAGKGVGLAVSAAEGLAAVTSHGDTLRQLMENLVSNAIKYTKAGGRVTVEFTAGPDGLRVIVDDTGIGIPAGEQAKLFTEFFRASNAKDVQEEGTGLGLALAKQTAERHGGTLRLCSEEGVGTTVTVDLPFRA